MNLRGLAALVACLTCFVAACSTVPGEGSGQSSAERAPRILRADSDGAVVFDPGQATVNGFARAGALVWRNTSIADTAIDIVCLARCPATVVSTEAAPGQPSGQAAPDPFRLTERGTEAFPVSKVPGSRVLTALSPRDAVVEERTGGRTWIRIIRPGGEERIKVPHSGNQWVESADRSAAIAFPGQPGGRMLRFKRDADGWKTAGGSVEPGIVDSVCVADRGERSLVVGQETTLVRETSERVRVDAALAEARECALGEQTAALVARATNDQGRFRTVVHGLSPDGRQAWRREFAAEAGVTAHPAEPYLGITHDRTFVLVDGSGRTVWQRDAVAAARFTPDGQLVVVSPDGTVSWLPADLIDPLHQSTTR
ncbi:hypothetical protein [Streptosporangium sp. KLBMP 9127]|nr:hypothetical protein [Streptosporangium sp. KLBMP 9127]